MYEVIIDYYLSTFTLGNNIQYNDLHLWPAVIFDINHLYLGIKGYH